MSAPSSTVIDTSGSLQSLQVGCYLIYGLAMIVVALRIYTRARIIGWLGFDDYFIIVAALGSTAVLVNVPFMFNLGVGLHISTLTDYQIFYGRRAAWVSQIFYYFTLGFIKCSIVALYIRLISRPLHLTVLYTLGTLIMAHGLTSSIVLARMCTPVSIIWGPTFPMHCINLLTFNYFNAAFHILSEILLATLPIPILLRLQLTPGKKIALAIVFGAGVLTIAVTVARQVFNFIALTGQDFSWDWAPTELTTNLEINMGIICASVPAIQILVRSAFGSTTFTSSSGHSKISSLRKSSVWSIPFSGVREIERRHVPVVPDVKYRSAEQFSILRPFVRGRDKYRGDVVGVGGNETVRKTTVTSKYRPDEGIQLREMDKAKVGAPDREDVLKMVEARVEFGLAL